MTALTIKNIPDELYRELKLVAEQHHRSINSEVIVRLKDTLLPRKISPTEVLKNVQAFRNRVTPNLVSPDDISNAINKGRE